MWGVYISEMTEQSRVGDAHVPDVPRPKMVLQQLNVPKNSNVFTNSQPSSPVTLGKGPGVKYNCLCSPTTHVGSFRCRHHRNMSRNSRSVGSKLNELAGDTWHFALALILANQFYQALSFCLYYETYGFPRSGLATRIMYKLHTVSLFWSTSNNYNFSSHC